MTTIAYSGKWAAAHKYKQSHKQFLKERRKPYMEREAYVRRRSTPEGWAKSSMTRLRYRARREGYEFSIDWEDILPPTHCPVLGMKLDYNLSGKANAIGSAPSVDRFDNNKGYSKENVRVISVRANLLKKDANVDEIRALLRYMEDR